MNAKKDKAQHALDRLAAFLVDDILDMDEQALQAELAEDGANATSINETKAIFEDAISATAKKRLADARAAVAADKQRGTKGVSIRNLDPTAARRKLDSILHANPDARQHLTLAARKEESLSHEDITGMLEDLADLGLLPDEDQ